MNKNIYLLIIGLFMLFVDSANACTTFLISGKYTRDGNPILFKNRDTKEMNNALVLFEDGKYKYMALVNATQEKDSIHSVWGGYNEQGFAIINSAAYNNNLGDTTKVKGHDGYVMKLALMYCKSINDFQILLDTIAKPMGVNSNFGVIDANGGAAYFETGNYKYVKMDANDPNVAPNGILIRTNHSMSGDLSKGFGFNRYDNAERILNRAVKENELTPEHLLKVFPRSLYHPRTKTDLTINIPKSKDEKDYRFFMDYIPRYSTSGSIMIVGAKDTKHVQDAMMWTILGFPLTSIAVPSWLSTGTIPDLLAMSKANLHAPLCDAALKFKAECFPITIDKGTNYINLSAVLNQDGNGYFQLLQPIEDKVFDKANVLIAGLNTGKKSPGDIVDFYKWMDNYLEKTYKKQFAIELDQN